MGPMLHHSNFYGKRDAEIRAPAFDTWRLQALAQIECSGEQTSKPVVHRFLQILLASEVAFRRQN
jgi:hypothetical protein